MKIFLPWEISNALGKGDIQSSYHLKNNALKLAAVKYLEEAIPIDILRAEMEMPPHPDTVMGLSNSRGSKFLHDVDEVREGDDKKPDGYDERLLQLLQGK